MAGTPAPRRAGSRPPSRCDRAGRSAARPAAPTRPARDRPPAAHAAAPAPGGAARGRRTAPPPAAAAPPTGSRSPAVARSRARQTHQGAKRRIGGQPPAMIGQQQPGADPLPLAQARSGQPRHPVGDLAEHEPAAHRRAMHHAARGPRQEQAGHQPAAQRRHRGTAPAGQHLEAVDHLGRFTPSRAKLLDLHQCADQGRRYAFLLGAAQHSTRPYEGVQQSGVPRWAYRRLTVRTTSSASLLRRRLPPRWRPAAAPR